MSSFTNDRAYLNELVGRSTATQFSEFFGNSIAKREYEKSIANITLAQKMIQSVGLSDQVRSYETQMAGMMSSKLLQNAVGGIELARGYATTALQAATRTQENLFGSGAAMQEYAKALDITNQVKRLAAGINANAAQSEYLKCVNSVNATSWIAEISDVARTNLDYLKATASASWIQQLSKSMVDDDLYRRFSQTLGIRQPTSSDLLSSAAEIAKQRYGKLFSTADAWAGQMELLKRPDYLETLLATFEHDTSFYADDAEVEIDENVENKDAEVLLNQLANADTPEQFAEILKLCPSWIKWALMIFLLYAVWPFVLGISVNLVTPSVEQYLHHTPAVTQREQIKDIKKLSIGELGVALRDYRFVTTTSLVLRANANSKSAQIGRLQFGQVVAIISSKADWSEVVYEYGDGQTVTGWVFTRYTEKFRR
ncbi:SH3 domain-containing protein [Undibacterium sp.]|uniref:SH3 domain-containing protein n=1 Tax=Undibacterium sp. TaxID=1914977 RepID=UPI0025F64046|nr:SH3 domain-containing protein [Undibacterium sp.]